MEFFAKIDVHFLDLGFEHFLLLKKKYVAEARLHAQEKLCGNRDKTQRHFLGLGKSNVTRHLKLLKIVLPKTHAVGPCGQRDTF